MKLSQIFSLIFILGFAFESLNAAHTNPQAELDAIIIGAGMAGLSAAKELQKNNKTFLILEAQDRIGGRAIVDFDTFIVPIDLGAAWLHGVDNNPLVPLADELGFHRIDTDLDGPIYVGNRLASSDELLMYEETNDILEDELARLSPENDKSIAELLPVDCPCADLVASNIGPLENGAELSEISGLTAGLFDTSNDDFLLEGLGTFVQAFGAGLRVKLNAQVVGVKYDEEGVQVRLENGENFKAKKVLVTVSNGVLAANKIIFEPALPAWKLEAIKALPMGLLNKIIFQFKTDIFKDTPVNSWVLWDGPGEDNIAFVIRPLGAPIAIAFYGGHRAKELEKDTEFAISHAKMALEQMFGLEIKSEFEKSALTAWGQNPWTFGSYSFVTPGASEMYKTMQKPVEKLIYFAGEACSRPQFNGSLHGAFESGIQAAQTMIEDF